MHVDLFSVETQEAWYPTYQYLRDEQPVYLVPVLRFESPTQGLWPNSGRHMAFSLGERHCPGAGLTRLEQALTLEAIFERFPNPRLSPDRNDFKHEPMFAMRSLRELHIDFDPSAKERRS